MIELTLSFSSNFHITGEECNTIIITLDFILKNTKINIIFYRLVSLVLFDYIIS